MRFPVMVGLALALFPSCNSSTDGNTAPAPEKQPLFANCSGGDECESGACLGLKSRAVCTRECDVDADCSFVWNATGETLEGDCLGSGTTKVCYPACEVAANQVCSKCGCQDPSQYCLLGQCVVKKALFEECAEHGECASANCGPRPNYSATVCLTAYGGPCTQENCEVCINGTFCTRTCSATPDCGHSDYPTHAGDWPRGDCLAKPGEQGYCYLSCYAQGDCDSIGFTCQSTAEPGERFCGPP